MTSWYMKLDSRRLEYAGCLTWGVRVAASWFVCWREDPLGPWHQRGIQGEGVVPAGRVFWIFQGSLWHVFIRIGNFARSRGQRSTKVVELMQLYWDRAKLLTREMKVQETAKQVMRGAIRVQIWDALFKTVNIAVSFIQSSSHQSGLREWSAPFRLSLLCSSLFDLSSGREKGVYRQRFP